MVNATFDELELSKELEVILEEIKRGDDSPSNCLSEMIFNSTFSLCFNIWPIFIQPALCQKLGQFFFVVHEVS